MDEESGNTTIKMGDVKKDFANADKTIEAEYYAPYLAHSAMEPMNAAAWVREDRCDIWSPNQGPTLIRNQAAKISGMSRSKVTVHTTKYLGGGFGRRSTTDYSSEAVEISKKMKKPIKVVWSREDDTKFSPMRPISLHKVKAAIKDGKPIAWHHRLACESIMDYVIPGWMPLMMPGWIPSFLDGTIGSVGGFFMRLFSEDTVSAEGARAPYDIASQQVDQYSIGLDIPIHFWRSVGHSYNGFVVESFIDEIASSLQQDPYLYRKKITGDWFRGRGWLYRNRSPKIDEGTRSRGRKVELV